jgi:catechol 2,3-dioxygenase-like lactoylglutathione lyase family enzyme
MNRRIAHIALVVDDYDDAIKFYTEKLDFILVADTQLSETKRWVIVTPSNDSNCSLLLAKAVNEQQKSSIGNQTGGRVFLFLETDNFDRDYKKFREKNINFIREPSQEPYGIVAVFEDLYGNLWDLIEYK